MTANGPSMQAAALLPRRWSMQPVPGPIRLRNWQASRPSASPLTAEQSCNWPLIQPAAADLPLVVGLDGSFYFKPEAGGRLWLSPHDEIATDPCDAAPEEIDLALAIDRFQQVVDWQIIRLERKWAGLRSFAPDRLPVIGRDPAVPAFFWLAGQGGFGIQTAPAVAALAAALLLGSTAMGRSDLADPATYAPE